MTVNRLKWATVLCSALFLGVSIATWFRRLASDSPLSAASGTPVLVCNDPAWDFGIRLTGEYVEHEFQLKNTGSDPIFIHSVRPSCGCTKATTDKTKLAPGETSRLTASLSLAGVYGRQSGSILIESSDPVNRILQLRISGVSESEFEAVPGSILFGEVRGDSTISKSLIVKSPRQSGESLRIIGVASNHDCIVPKIESQSEQGTRISISIVGPLAPGRVESRVRVQTTSKTQPEIIVPVSFQAVGELVVSPSSLTISRDPSILQTKHLVVRPGRTSDFRIADVQTPFEGSEVSIAELTPGSSSRRITLSKIRADRLPEGPLFVRIVTDLSVDPVLLIPITVVGQTASSD